MKDFYRYSLKSISTCLIAISLVVFLAACNQFEFDGFDIRETNTPGIWLTPTIHPSQTPIDDPSPTQTANPITSADFPIIQANLITDEEGFSLVTGLIRNDTDKIAADILLEIQHLNALGETVQIDSVYALLKYHFPGEIAPFSMKLANPSPMADQVRLSVVDFNIVDLQRENITIHNDMAKMEIGRAHV